MAYERLTKYKDDDNSLRNFEFTSAGDLFSLFNIHLQDTNGSGWYLAEVDYTKIPLTGNKKLDKAIQDMCKKTEKKAGYREMTAIVFFLSCSMKCLIKMRCEVEKGTIKRKSKNIELSEEEQEYLLKKLGEAEEKLYKEAIKEKEYSISTSKNLAGYYY